MHPGLWVSVLEVAYLSFMFHFFKTSADLNFLRSPESYLFKHLTGSDHGLRVCLFGRIMIVPLAAVLILRHFVHIPRAFIIGSFGLATLLSLINLNALFYLLPVIAAETCTRSNWSDIPPKLKN